MIKIFFKKIQRPLNSVSVKSKKVFLKLDESKKPFRSDPSFLQQQHKSGGQKQIITGNRRRSSQTKLEQAQERHKFSRRWPDFKVKTSPTQLFLDTSPVIPNAELVNVHPLIKRFLFKRDFNLVD